MSARSEYVEASYEQTAHGDDIHLVSFEILSFGLMLIVFGTAVLLLALKTSANLQKLAALPLEHHREKT